MGTPNPSPTNAAGNSLMHKPGDWTCPNCGDLQFARNQQCRRCGAAPGPETLQAAPPLAPETFGGQPQTSGDWHCPNCGELQASANLVCGVCTTFRPGGCFEAAVAQQGHLGGTANGAASGKPLTSWTCPSCGTLVFRRHSHCQKCGIGRPALPLPAVEQVNDGRGRPY